MDTFKTVTIVLCTAGFVILFLSLVSTSISKQRPDIKHATKNRPSSTLIDKPTQEIKMKRLPKAIIIGVKKCGTFALRWILMTHPDLVFTEKKEANFFRSYNYKWYLERLFMYKRLMGLSYRHQITMEKSPRYFTDSKSPEMIHTYNDSIRLILTVRDPIQRFISDYYYEKRKERLAKNCKVYHVNWKEMPKPFNDNTIEDIIQLPRYRKCRDYLLAPSFYHSHFVKWMKYFNKSQMHIVDGDNFIKHPIEEIQRIETFLSIEPFFTPQSFIFNKTKGLYCLRTNTGEEKCLDHHKGKIWPGITEKSKSILKNLLKEDVALFKHDTPRTFEWMNNY